MKVIRVDRPKALKVSLGSIPRTRLGVDDTGQLWTFTGKEIVCIGGESFHYTNYPEAIMVELLPVGTIVTLEVTY